MISPAKKIKCKDCNGAGFYLKHEGQGYYRDGSFGHNEWEDCRPCGGTGDARERLDFKPEAVENA